MACGIQFGKTKVGSVWMKLKNHTYTDPSDNFLIVAPTYKILTQSTLPPYLQIMQDYGTYSKSDMTLKIHGGGTVYMRSGTDADSVVGITNIRALWGDEAGLFTLYFAENLAARAAFRAAQTLYTTSPYTLNWLYKQIILPKSKDPNNRPDVTLIQAASWENPYFPKHVIEQNEKTMDPRRFQALFGGQWQRMTGLVYDCFDEQENVCKPFTLPEGTEYVAGVDWGFTNPFAMTVRAITPDGFHFQVAEFYRTGLSPSQKVEAAKRLKLVFNIKMFYCDPEEAASIAEFNANGIPAVAADNDVKRGVELHYELIRSRRFKVFEGSSPYSMDEYETYHWPEPKDLRPDQDEKDPNPVAQNNHACLAAGTMVLTPSGNVPIEQIVPGQLVCTPLGARRVVDCGMTGIKPTVTAEFSNGTRIEATADHPYYLCRKGFRSIVGFDFGMVHACGNDTNTLNSMAGAIGGTASIGLLLAAARMVASASTWLSGSSITAPFRRAIMSIMWTTTAITTTFRTLRLCLRSNTLGITASTYPSPFAMSAAPGSIRFATSPKHGTDLPRALLGIRSMLRSHYATSRRDSLAKTAARNSTRQAQVPRFARTIVSLLLDAKAALTTLTSFAQFARRRSERTSTPARKPVRMLAVGSTSREPKPVYNLTVDEAGCFYANGILVSNCDSARYITISTVRRLEDGHVRRRRPTVPTDMPKVLDVHAETEILKRGPRRGGAEEWS